MDQQSNLSNQLNFHFFMDDSYRAEAKAHATLEITPIMYEPESGREEFLGITDVTSGLNQVLVCLLRFPDHATPTIK